MAIGPDHEPGCDCGRYRCKGLGFSMSTGQASRARRPFRDGNKINKNSWERGVAGEHRPDGSFMPYIDDTGRKIHVKEYGERRHELEAVRKSQLSGTDT